LNIFSSGRYALFLLNAFNTEEALLSMLANRDTIMVNLKM
jgi:hypothetical protein